MNLLAVDDEGLALAALEDALEKAVLGASIHGARTAAQAIALAEERSFDVAFLDVKIRGTTGLALAKTLQEIQPQLNIVFVTGYAEYALEAFQQYASGYLLKPVTADQIAQAMEHLRYPEARVDAPVGLQVQCFGEFTVFYKGEPVYFSRQKSKEMFAYLIDRRGALVTMAQIADVLWEDGKYNISRNKQLHTYLTVLQKTLEEYHCEDILVRKHNALGVKVGRLNCDYYQFLQGDCMAMRTYRGEYMSQYSWAESTNGGLSHINYAASLKAD